MEKKNYILMRFYGGGGLADWKIVKCLEEELLEHLKKFEEDCISQNLGERIGVLEENEFEEIAYLYERVTQEDFEICRDCKNKNRIVNGLCDFAIKDGSCFEPIIKSKCKDCGITLDGTFELEDNRCANCQADYIRTKAKSTLKATIDMLNYLSEDDFEQDNELVNLYDELEYYFTR